MGIKEMLREAVRGLLVQYPGIKSKEIAERLGIAEHTAGRHVRAITEEWARKDGDAGK